MILLVCSTIINGQVKKIKVVESLIEADKCIEAVEIVNRIKSKHGDEYFVLFYEQKVQFLCQKDIDKSLKTCVYLLKNFESTSNAKRSDDSLNYNYHKKHVIEFMEQIIKDNFNQILGRTSVDMVKYYHDNIPLNAQQKYQLIQKYCELSYESLLESEKIEEVEYFIKQNPECPNALEFQKLLEALHWNHAKNSNLTEIFYSFIEKFPNSKKVDSSNYFIQRIEWYDIQSERNQIRIVDYLREAPLSIFRDSAQTLLDEIRWISIMNATNNADVETILASFLTEEYIQKAEAYSDSILWHEAKLKNNLGKYIDYIEKCKLCLNFEEARMSIKSIKYTELIWNNRLAAYRQSTGKYFRTVTLQGGDFISFKDWPSHRGIKVDEIYLSNAKDIIYAINGMELFGQRLLILNGPDQFGYIQESKRYRQYFDASFVSLDTGEFFDTHLGFMDSPRGVSPVPSYLNGRYSFTFNQIKQFPYFRLSRPDYLFGTSLENHKGVGRQPYNSELIYSLRKDTILTLPMQDVEMRINFSTANNVFELENQLYSISELKKYKLEEIIGSQDYKVYSFNDSVCILASNGDFQIVNFILKKSRKIELLSKLPQKGPFYLESLNIDHSSKYLYIEYQAHDAVKEGFAHGKYLSVFNLITGKLVFLGPYMSIDKIADDDSWVFTTTKQVENRRLKTATTKDEKAFYGLYWIPSNYALNRSIDENVGDYYVRYLFNLTSFFSEDYQSLLSAKITERLPPEDFFNESIVVQRRYVLTDSLIKSVFNWLPNSQVKEASSELSFNPHNVDSTVYGYLDKVYDWQDRNTRSLPRFESKIPKFISVINDGNSFVFNFEVDSLPIDFLKAQEQYLGFLKRKSNLVLERQELRFPIKQNHERHKYFYGEVGTLFLEQQPFSFSTTSGIDSLCKFNFRIEIQDPQVAREFNSSIAKNKKVISFAILNRTYGFGTGLEWEEHLMRSSFNQTNSAINDHYMYEFMRELKESGSQYWGHLSFYQNDEFQCNECSTLWYFPLDFKLKGLYK